MTVAPPEPPERLPLAALFPDADREQWRELVATALRKSGRIGTDDGADVVEEALTSLTYEGIGRRPLYTADDAPPFDAAGEPGQYPFVRGRQTVAAAPTGWDVRQQHSDPDSEAAREAVMTDLENGVTSLWLTIGNGGRGGLPLGALDRVLSDVYLDLAPVVLDAGADTEAAAEEFLAVVAARSVEAESSAAEPIREPIRESIRGNLGADPIGLRARTGADLDLALVSRLAQRVRAEAPGLRAVTVDARLHHDAGGSDADELGASLATGLAYLRELTGAGLDLEQAFGQLEFRYAAGADQFLTIAKFRAARRLWARVAQVCGVEAEGQLQHAVTSSAMMTRRDPWVNMLRSTLACFGAGVGGADSITVLPFDDAIGRSDGFARRIARNTSSLLMMESHVARVMDPAGGSWYVERLTDELATAAWDWFTEIERAGGMVAALDDGLVQQRLAATWAERRDHLARRQDTLTGVSEFPNLDEAPVVRVPYPAEAEGGLPRHRNAEEYEALRDAADRQAQSTGVRPVVFLATLGPAAAHTARASFAANLFQAGGLATPTSGPGVDPARIAAAFKASGARVACLASSEKVYAEHAAPVASALKAAGAEQIWRAGSPAEQAGVDGYVFVGVDALAVLRSVHTAVGIDA